MPIAFNSTAVTLQDNPDHYALLRHWYRDGELVQEEAFKLPKELGPTTATTKGDVPLASLKAQHEIVDNDNETSVALVYFMDGELVKRSAHVILKRGNEAAGVAAAFG